ncbi:MAG: carbohydrate ABC transporter permease [Chloroflexi bacterium]|nr:carbohydrate ABC transporter permease [Anaerolinea sp.]TDA66879.1 MAG: carbohydrate ABC transporter permease [Chloroflexota bacterium]
MAKFRRNYGITISHIILIISSLAILLPILWVIRTSLANRLIAYKIPPVWFFKPTLDNYLTIFAKYPFQEYFVNSLVISGIASIVALIIGSLAAYSIARFKTGDPWLRLSMLSTQMLPPIALVIPIFLLMRVIQMWDTLPGLVLAYLSFNLPYTVWILIGFFQSIPVEIEEAAMIDGCSRLQALLRVIFPVALPGLLSAGVFNFILNWNEFLFALILTGRNTRTLPVAIASLWTQQGVNIGAVSAATVVTILPVVILTYVIQKSLVRNLTFGSVK